MNWREGRGGFVGNIKYWIKGVFQNQYSVTTDIVVPEPSEIILISDTGRTVEVPVLKRTVNINDIGRTVEIN